MYKIQITINNINKASIDELVNTINRMLRQATNEQNVILVKDKTTNGIKK